MQVYNFEIAGLIRRIVRFMKELHYSQSANVAAVSAADQNRFKTFLTAIEQNLDFVIGQEPLDLPKGSPELRELTEMPTLPMVENEAIQDMIEMYKSAVKELSQSQSARYSNGMIPQDAERLRSVIAKQRAFLDGYVANIQPLDLVETVPSRPMNGPGAQGV